MKEIVERGAAAGARQHRVIDRSDFIRFFVVAYRITSG